MSKCVLIVLAVAALGLAPAGAAAKTAAHADLWATVNLCDTPSKPGAVGVRVSIPRERGAPRSGPASACSGSTAASRVAHRALLGRRRRLGALRHRDPPGAGRHDVHLPAPEAGARIVLRGTVDVEWRDGTEVVDRARMITTAGHRDGKDRQRRVSRSSCEIMR